MSIRSVLWVFRRLYIAAGVMSMLCLVDIDSNGIAQTFVLQTCISGYFRLINAWWLYAHIFISSSFISYSLFLSADYASDKIAWNNWQHCKDRLAQTAGR